MNFKRFIPALAAFGLIGSAFAEGNSPAIDTTVASGALSDMVAAFQTYLTAALPYLVTLLGACLGVTLVWLAWKWIKKGTSKA